MTSPLVLNSRGAPHWLPIYCLLAGCCDSVTGVLLGTAPSFTLKLMGVAPASPDLHLRFVGVFVGSIGLSYLYPFLGNLSQRPMRWRVVLEVTTLVRSLVAVFLTLQIVRGNLPVAWSSVPLTDGLLAVTQCFILWRWRTSHGD